MAVASKAELRQEVLWFAGEMERKLRENDHKAHWRHVPDGVLLRGLRHEVDELADALVSGKADEIIREAADVANYAMMVADKAARAVPESRESTVTITCFRSDSGEVLYRIAGKKDACWTPYGPGSWGDGDFRGIAGALGVEESEVYRAAREFMGVEALG